MRGCRSSRAGGPPDVGIPELVLRDIHQPPAPAWWPPAPGWWWLAGLVLVLLAGIGLRAWQRARRRRRWRQQFDAEVGAGADAPARIAAMSALLRRAARRVRADSDRLEGDAWLAFLDAGADPPGFLDGPGVHLRDGAFRREAEGIDLDALHRLARLRFVSLMQARR